MSYTTTETKLSTCAWCSTQPLDPIWARVGEALPGVICLGCIADLRAKGQSVICIRRASRLDANK